MTLPAESQVGRRAVRPARREPGRWMAAHDKIRLTGRLRGGPAQAGSLYFTGPHARRGRGGRHARPVLDPDGNNIEAVCHRPPA